MQVAVKNGTVVARLEGAHMEQPERDQRIAAMIEPELRQEIEDLALAEDRSMSSVIRTLLREALEARSVSVAA